MTNKIEKDIIKNLDTSKNYVVALSGGVDSAVLATVVAKQTSNLRSIFVRHNQKHSKELEEVANKIANNLKINHKALDSNLEENSSETKMRDARYEILYDELDDNEILLTGHTLSDKVETFFINLLRGTRVRGLKSIPNMTPRLKRPLLGISKDNLINYAKENNIEYLDDVTNFDNKIIRNWIRNELIPKVDEKFPGDIEEKISSLITEIESIFETTEIEFKYIKTAKGYIEIPVTLIKEKNIKSNMYLSLLSKTLGIPSLQKKDIQKVTTSINDEKKVDFDNNWSCGVSNALLIFINKKIWQEQYESKDQDLGLFKFSSLEKIKANNNWTASLPKKENINIAPLKNGDKIKVNGNTIKVSEIFRNYGIKNVLKEVWPVVSIGDEVYWVPGIRKSDSLIDYEKSGKSNIITASIEKSSIEDY
ncbi:MAG: tRNA lysidine(34) synthetase TilS [Actinomycetota bacterium]|nr:tRNA lysidine(34) synthetase TilS [Actinomycetota bacterium]